MTHLVHPPCGKAGPTRPPGTDPDATARMPSPGRLANADAAPPGHALLCELFCPILAITLLVLGSSPLPWNSLRVEWGPSRLVLPLILAGPLLLLWAGVTTLSRLAPRTRSSLVGLALFAVSFAVLAGVVSIPWMEPNDPAVPALWIALAAAELARCLLLGSFALAVADGAADRALASMARLQWHAAWVAVALAIVPPLAALCHLFLLANGLRLLLRIGALAGAVGRGTPTPSA